VHQGWRIRSPILCSVTTTPPGGICAAAYRCTWASVLALKAGTASSSDPASAAPPAAAPFQVPRQFQRHSSVHQ
jgi:hypothetical protein